MKYAHWIFVLLLLGTVVWVASVPTVDDPDTPVDESEIQVILATPSSLSIKSVPPLAECVDAPSLASRPVESKAERYRHTFLPVARNCCSLSTQKLLCTFLI